MIQEIIKLWLAVAKDFIRSRLTRQNLDILMVVLALATGFYLSWPLTWIVGLVIIVWHLQHPFRSQDIAKTALVALLLAVGAVITKRQAYAELLSTAAFIILAVSVILSNFSKRSDEA